MSAPASTKTPLAPKVDLDATRDRLVRLGLQHAADELESQLTDTVKHRHEPAPDAGRALGSGAGVARGAAHPHRVAPLGPADRADVGDL